VVEHSKRVFPTFLFLKFQFWRKNTNIIHKRKILTNCQSIWIILKGCISVLRFCPSRHIVYITIYTSRTQREEATLLTIVRCSQKHNLDVFLISRNISRNYKLTKEHCIVCLLSNLFKLSIAYIYENPSGRIRPLKTDERNPMNMTTTVGKHRFGKGDRW